MPLQEKGMAEYVGLALNSLIALCFCLGVYDVLKNAFKHCECEMSFMYELPQYKKVTVFGLYLSSNLSEVIDRGFN